MLFVRLSNPDRNSKELVELVTKSRTVLSSFAKAKTAKLGNSWPLIAVVGKLNTKEC